MNPTQLPGMFDSLASPATFALLAMLAVGLIWLALSPPRPRQDVSDRMSDYLERGDIIEETDLDRPLMQRTLLPVARSTMRFFGNLLPRRNIELTQRKLEQAGRPWGMSALDFEGLRLMGILAGVVVAGYLTTRSHGSWLVIARNALFAGVLGFTMITYWLRLRVKSRKHQVQRALPDALDMMTIGVEAGLAFESAMVHVGDKWHNALTEELRRAVGEMRVGMTREQALKRMSERCGVDDLSTFVAVLVQSTTLGVSIAQVLHTQADQMRLKRRLRAEELARQAGIKMVFPLVFLIFPTMFVVVLGPAVPSLMGVFGNISLGGLP